MVRQIENIFEQIDDFERGAASFQDKNFIRAFQGVLEYFQVIGEDLEKVRMADQSLLRSVQSTHLQKSALRYLTAHTLTTVFDYMAGAKTKSEAYVHCRRLRSNQKDSAFFAQELTPKLFDPEGLRGNHGIRYLFMYQTCMLQEVSGDPNPLHDDLSLAEVERMDPNLVVLGLFRRIVKSGSRGSMSQKGTLEYKLTRSNVLSLLAESNPVHELLLKEWGYVEKGKNFWERLRSSLGSALRIVGGSLASFRFFLHFLTQRNGGYLLYGALILLFLWAAIYVPLRLGSYGDKRLEEFIRTSEEVEAVIGAE